MNFLNEIRHSVYNPVYYRQLLNRDFKYSLAYYVKFSLVVALLWSTALGFSLVPISYKLLEDMSVSLTEIYPDNLELKLASGELSKNIAGPVAIAVPKTSPTDVGAKRLVVVDTDATASLETYEKANTYVLVTKKAIVYMDKTASSRLQITGFEPTMNGTLDQAKIQDFITKAKPWLKIFLPVLLIAIFVGIFCLMLAMLVPFALLALAVWLILFILKDKLVGQVKYLVAYRLTLHAVTAPFLLGIVFSLLFNNSLGFLLFCGLTMAIVYLNLQENISSAS